LTEALNAIKEVIGGVVGFFNDLYNAVQKVIDKIKEYLGLPTRSSAGSGGLPGSGRALVPAPAMARSGFTMAGSAGGLATTRIGDRGRTAPNVVIVVKDNQFGNRTDIDYMLKQLDRKLRLEGGILPI
jgi:hypothetical protein